jgi:hypothetical protein
MKTGPDALGTAENESERAKYENETRRPRYCRKRVRERNTQKRDLTPSVPLKTSPGAHNMKTGSTPSVPPYMSPDAQKMKKESYALGTAENESGRAKHEKGTRRRRYRRK